MLGRDPHQWTNLMNLEKKKTLVATSLKTYFIPLILYIFFIEKKY